MNFEKYKIAFIILLHLLGIFGGWVLRGHFIEDNKIAALQSNSKETFHSEVLKTGTADTAFTAVSITGTGKVTKQDPGFVSPAVPQDQRAAWSEFKKDFTGNDGSISVGVKTYPGVDSAEISAIYNGFNKVIKRVDTLEKKDSVKSDSKQFLAPAATSGWRLSFGASKDFENDVDIKKYFDVTYKRKLWFLWLNAGGGVHNGFNAGLKDINVHAKLELSMEL